MPLPPERRYNERVGRPYNGGGSPTLIFQASLPAGRSTNPGGRLLGLHRAVPSAPLDESVWLSGANIQHSIDKSTSIEPAAHVAWPTNMIAPAGGAVDTRSTHRGIMRNHRPDRVRRTVVTLLLVLFVRP
jgi:hypothetical protein